jgi:hypothetical protein
VSTSFHGGCAEANNAKLDQSMAKHEALVIALSAVELLKNAKKFIATAIVRA